MSIESKFLEMKNSFSETIKNISNSKRLSIIFKNQFIKEAFLFFTLCLFLYIFEKILEQIIKNRPFKNSLLGFNASLTCCEKEKIIRKEEENGEKLSKQRIEELKNDIKYINIFNIKIQNKKNLIEKKLLKTIEYGLYTACLTILFFKIADFFKKDNTLYDISFLEFFDAKIPLLNNSSFWFAMCITSSLFFSIFSVELVKYEKIELKKKNEASTNNQHFGKKIFLDLLKDLSWAILVSIMTYGINGSSLKNSKLSILIAILCSSFISFRMLLLKRELFCPLNSDKDMKLIKTSIKQLADEQKNNLNSLNQQNKKIIHGKIRKITEQILYIFPLLFANENKTKIRIDVRRFFVYLICLLFCSLIVGALGFFLRHIFANYISKYKFLEFSYGFYIDDKFVKILNNKNNLLFICLFDCVFGILATWLLIGLSSILFNSICNNLFKQDQVRNLSFKALEDSKIEKTILELRANKNFNNSIGENSNSLNCCKEENKNSNNRNSSSHESNSINNKNSNSSGPNSTNQNSNDNNESERKKSKGSENKNHNNETNSGKRFNYDYEVNNQESSKNNNGSEKENKGFDSRQNYQNQQKIEGGNCYDNKSTKVDDNIKSCCDKKSAPKTKQNENNKKKSPSFFWRSITNIKDVFWKVSILVLYTVFFHVITQTKKSIFEYSHNNLKSLMIIGAILMCTFSGFLMTNNMIDGDSLSRCPCSQILPVDKWLDAKVTINLLKIEDEIFKTEIEKI